MANDLPLRPRMNFVCSQFFSSQVSYFNSGIVIHTFFCTVNFKTPKTIGDVIDVRVRKNSRFTANKWMCL